MIVYKANLDKMLHDAGYNPDEVIGSNAGDTEKGSPIKLKIETIEKVCELLDLQPGDIMENTAENAD